MTATIIEFTLRDGTKRPAMAWNPSSSMAAKPAAKRQAVPERSAYELAVRHSLTALQPAGYCVADTMPRGPAKTALDAAISLSNAVLACDPDDEIVAQALAKYVMARNAVRNRSR